MAGQFFSQSKGKDVRMVVENLLDAYTLTNKHGEWRSVCPLHHGATNTTSFRVTESGFWECYSCKASGQLVELVQRIGHLSFDQARTLMADLPARRVSLDEALALLKRTSTTPKLLDESTIAPYRGVIPIYLLERGFKPATIKRYGIGYDFDRQKITLPVRDQAGRLVGVTYRQDGDAEGGYRIGPKYWHDHFDKSSHLWGLHLWKGQQIDTLALTEGQFDSMRLTELGIPSAALMGAYVSYAQADLLVGIHAKKIVLMLDNDEAGKRGEEHALRMLAKHPSIGRRLHVGSYPGKDPGELTSLRGYSAQHWTDRIIQRIHALQRTQNLSILTGTQGENGHDSQGFFGLQRGQQQKAFRWRRQQPPALYEGRGHQDAALLR